MPSAASTNILESAKGPYLDKLSAVGMANANCQGGMIDIYMLRND
jgi:hypothetical protein